jgi:hypothetical protein
MNLGWRVFNARAPLDLERGRRWMEEFRALRHLAVGDFYALLPHTLSEGQWLASQYHRPDLDEGMVLAFRRRHCSQATVVVRPQPSTRRRPTCCAGTARPARRRSRART